MKYELRRLLLKIFDSALFSNLVFLTSLKLQLISVFSFFPQEMSPGGLTIKPLNLAAKFDCYSDSDEENNE
jgi:hypothetical protein